MKWTRQRCQGEADQAMIRGIIAPSNGQNLGNGGLDTLMRVADHQLDPAQPPARELAQELGPEGFRLGGPDIGPRNLAAAITVDTHGDDRGDRDDPVVLTHFYIGRVDPQVGPIAFKGPVQEPLHLLVDFPA